MGCKSSSERSIQEGVSAVTKPMAAVEIKQEKNDFPQDRYGGILIEDMSLLADTETDFRS